MKIVQKRSKLNKKNAILLVLILLAIGLGITYAYYHSMYSSDSSRKNDPKITKDGNSSSNSSNSRNGGTIASPLADGTPEDSTSTESAPSTKPIAPSGVFVSNHHPNLSGSPAPNTISSTCTTSPGVDCYIELKNGEIVKSLSRQKTDSNGNTSWFWNISDIGLTQGAWTITAIAANGSLQTNSKDPMDLVVEK